MISRRNRFIRDRLWFLYRIIKPRPYDSQFRVLQKMPSSEFTEDLFVSIIRKELESAG
jgi:hypothetical protein